MSTEYREGYVYPGMSPQAIQDLITYIYDTTYPIGSYYETTDTTFNPNESFVGEWELETEGLVHISSGTNYAVSANAKDGGNSSINLQHSHTVNNHAHGAGTLNAGINIFKSGSRIYIDYNQRGGSSYSENYRAYIGSSDCANSTHGETNTTGAGIVGSTGNANPGTDSKLSTTQSIMQPYKIVNRWHRTA